MGKQSDIHVRAGDSRYCVVFSSFRHHLAEAMKGAGKVIVVSNATIFALHGRALLERIVPKGIDAIPLLMGDGERYKNQATINRLHDHFFDIGVGRHDVIIAFGGGVVGDTAGFAAATFMRGMRLIQIPTSLLAMVDSSVGGKTGINHRLGKNLIGAFYQPKLVVINSEWLHTLGTREMFEGLAEIIKAGFLSSRHLVKISAAAEERLPDVRVDELTPLVAEAIRFKAKVVAGDPRDLGGRMILNFGHTFGHAIERAEGYGRYRHGEAVLAGMIGALYLSRATKRLSASDFDECMRYIRPAAARLRPLKKAISNYVEPMTVDKKKKGGKNHFVLLERIGRPVIREVRAKAEVLESVKYMMDVVNNRGKV